MLAQLSGISGQLRVVGIELSWQLAQQKTIARPTVHFKSFCKLYPNRYSYLMNSQPKKLMWIGSAKKDLVAMPEDVQDVFGFALHLAQAGEKHDKAKPLKGFGGAGVLEVVERDHD